VPFLDVYFSSIRFSDVDNDGDLDALLTGFTAQAITKLYLNDGTGTFSEFTDVPFVSIAAGAVAFSDIDNDGDQDVL
ncbi:VCBS repeat-containing protein, partial [Klebsiella pneumoniae]|uniref:FG-GAP repeat domain-containing protein n=1 Tax=Klebsiella pneumoniae TaxID=573 RepID=UPI002730EEC7